MKLKKLNIGDNIPEFEVLDQDGKPFTNKDILGKKAIIFFYPKDMTPGCTAEACNLRDNYQELQKRGYEIYGVSPDSPQRHQKFIAKYDFPYTLLSDESKAMLKSFGVWGEKKFMGRTYDGVHRTTFIIDEKGTITGRIDKVKTKDHAAQLLEIID